MKKLKLISSLSCLGVLTVATPVVVTSCSNNNKVPVSVNGLTATQNNVLAFATYAGFTGQSNNVFSQANTEEEDMTLLNTLIPQIDAFFETDISKSYTLTSTGEGTGLMFHEEISFVDASAKSKTFVLEYQTSERPFNDTNDDDEEEIITYIKGTAWEKESNADIYDLTGKFTREEEKGHEVEIEEKSELTFKKQTNPAEGFKIKQENSQEEEHGKTEVETEFKFKDLAGNTIYNYECELENNKKEIEFSTGDGSAENEYDVIPTTNTSGKITQYNAYKLPRTTGDIPTGTWTWDGSSWTRNI